MNAPDASQRMITVGRLHGAFGVRGEVKLESFTDPLHAIARYQPWILRDARGQERACEGVKLREGVKGLIASMPGVADRDAADALRGVGIARGANSSAQRVDHHHHARTTAERTVIDPTVIALGMVARVPAMDRQQPALAGAPDHAMRGELGDEFGEQADDVEAHRHRRQKSASQSTVTRPASKSTLRM